MVRRGDNRDGAQHDGRDNSYGRESFSPYGDDSATHYIPRDGGRRDGRGYNPDSDFAGEQPTEYFGNDASETQYIQRDNQTRFDDSRGAGAGPGNETAYGPGYGSGYGYGSGQGSGAQGSGQYWAPLSEEERGYGQAGQQPYQGQQYFAGAGGYGAGGYGAGGYGESNNFDNRSSDNRNNDDSKKGWGKSVAIVAIAAIVAVVALVALVLSFSSGTKDKAGEQTQETSSSPTTTTEETTTSPVESIDPSGTVDEARQRLEKELENLRQTPPPIPGPDQGGDTPTIPDNVVGKSPAAVEIELRTSGYQNITVVDAEGNQTSSVAALLGKVASIDPPEGQEADTSTPVTIYLQ